MRESGLKAPALLTKFNQISYQLGVHTKSALLLQQTFKTEHLARLHQPLYIPSPQMLHQSHFCMANIMQCIYTQACCTPTSTAQHLGPNPTQSVPPLTHLRPQRTCLLAPLDKHQLAIIQCLSCRWEPPCTRCQQAKLAASPPSRPLRVAAVRPCCLVRLKSAGMSVSSAPLAY